MKVLDLRTDGQLHDSCNGRKQKGRNIIIHKKSLMFKYGRMQKKIPSRLMCGSRGLCLDYMLPGVQVTAGLGYFSVFKSSCLVCVQ